MISSDLIFDMVFCGERSEPHLFFINLLKKISLLKKIQHKIIKCYLIFGLMKKGGERSEPPFLKF